MKKIDLKRCPFCGSKPMLLDYAEKELGRKVYAIKYRIECSVCSANINGPNKLDVINLWNRRDII